MPCCFCSWVGSGSPHEWATGAQQWESTVVGWNRKVVEWVIVYQIWGVGQFRLKVGHSLVLTGVSFTWAEEVLGSWGSGFFLINANFSVSGNYYWLFQQSKGSYFKIWTSPHRVFKGFWNFFLTLHKPVPELGTKHSIIWSYGDHSYLNHHICQSFKIILSFYSKYLAHFVTAISQDMVWFF